MKTFVVSVLSLVAAVQVAFAHNAWMQETRMDLS